jgi:hypothetical protein
MYPSNNSKRMNNPKDAMMNEGGSTAYPSCNIMDGADKSINGTKQLVTSAGCSMRKMADSLGHDAALAGQTIAAHIRHRPVQSSIIAISLGVVMGMLARR